MPLKPQRITVANLKGFRRDPSTPTRGDFAYGILNLLPRDAINGGPLDPRPGLNHLGSTTALAEIQHITEFAKANGNRERVIIAGGEIFSLANWTGASWTTEITGAQLTAASITLKTTGRVWSVVLNGNLVVSDGVNTPFMWDGTGGGGLTLLSNAPVFYGPPTIYAGKVFGIKNAERDTMVWSEENDPTTGYEAGGFNNSWSLTQTGDKALEAIKGTNDALFFWRIDSIGAIQGKVTPTFRSEATDDLISEGIGTRFPDAILVHGRDIWFADQRGRFQVLHIDSGLRTPAPWLSLADEFSSPAFEDTDDHEYSVQFVGASEVGSIISTSTCFHVPGTDLVGFTLGTTPASTQTFTKILFHDTTYEPQSIWQKAGAVSLTDMLTTVWTDTGGDPRLVVADGNSGFVWGYDRIDGRDEKDDDTLHGFIMHVVGPRHLETFDTEWQFEEFHGIVQTHDLQAGDLQFSWITPEKWAEETGADLDQVTIPIDAAKAVDAHNEEHFAVGLGILARWVHFRLQWTVDDTDSSNRFSFVGYNAWAYPDGVEVSAH